MIILCLYHTYYYRPPPTPSHPRLFKLLDAQVRRIINFSYFLCHANYGNLVFSFLAFGRCSPFFLFLFNFTLWPNLECSTSPDAN